MRKYIVMLMMCMSARAMAAERVGTVDVIIGGNKDIPYSWVKKLDDGRIARGLAWSDVVIFNSDQTQIQDDKKISVPDGWSVVVPASDLEDIRRNGGD